MTDYRDRARDWAREDREAWAAYRKWEEQQFPLDPARPLEKAFPRAMLAARRAFEKEQRIRRKMAMLRERFYVNR